MGYGLQDYPAGQTRHTANEDHSLAGIHLPDPETSAGSGIGVGEAERIAREVGEFHRTGLSRRRYRDLTAEKYLIHIDGEGDGQWADILNGERVVIPPSLSGGPRAQYNLLRPLVDNTIAYHTTMPFRFIVGSKLGRDREQSLVDQALINYLAAQQEWNALFAEAMYLAAPYGHCPIHAYWRDEQVDSPFDEPSGDLGLSSLMPVPGRVDCWVGDPWDTVYHSGATRTSVQAYSYGRTLPAELVRNAFSYVPGIETVEGSDRLPSASRFQRIARRWLYGASRDVHGTATVYGGQGGDELLAIVCRETAPGVLPDWPDGRLEIVALNGAATTQVGEATGGYGYGRPFLLHVGPLPGRVFSAVRVYSSSRFDDVLGKPYVADLDDLQVQMNQMRTLVNEYIRRSTRAPLVTPTGTDRDTLIWEDDIELELDASAQMMPQFLELPGKHVPLIQYVIQQLEEAMFRIGGWQAASRGEGSAGDSGRKVLALARADDTIHGPTNQRFRETVERYAGLCWRLYKQYADVPTLIDVVGDELAYLADPWIDKSRMSPNPPTFKLVSGYGATPESKGEQLLQLVQLRGSDGEPLMTTRQFRSAWPDDSTYPDDQDPYAVRIRRPRVVNASIRAIARNIVKQNPQLAQAPIGDPIVQRLAIQLNQSVQQQFPILMDDDLRAHIDALSLLTQDETELPLARAIAAVRQRYYYMWAMQQAQARAAQEQPAQPQQEQRQNGQRGGNAAAQEQARAAEAGGTSTAAALERAAAQHMTQ